MSGGGGSGSDKGGGGGGPPSVMNPPSKDIPDRNRGSQQYTAPKPKPKPKPKPTVTVRGGGADIMPVTKPKPKPKVVTTTTTKGGGGTPKVDVGFQEALRKQKIRQQDPVYGDPDPYIDDPISERDTITSFLDNYKANVKANPLKVGLLGMLETAYQTNQARNMLKGTPGYEFLDNSRGGGSQNQVTPLVGGGADQDANLQKLVNQSSFAKAGIKPVESVAAKWYKNLGSVSNNFAYQSAYASAKAKQQGILGSPSPLRYHAVSESPFYNWLKDNSLNKGIL